MLLEVLHLLEHRLAGSREHPDPTHDDTTVLALGMRIDSINGERHRLVAILQRSRRPGSVCASKEGNVVGSEVVLYTLNTEARTPT